LHPRSGIRDTRIHFGANRKACARHDVDRDAGLHPWRARHKIACASGEIAVAAHAAAALLLALAGCGLPATVVVLLPEENGTVGKVTVHEGGSTAELTRPLASVNAGSEASARNVFTAHRSDVDGEFAAAPRAPVAHVLYFRTGSTELDPSSLDPLAA